MAFRKTVNTQIGVQVHDAYHRVEFVTIDKSKKRIDFHLRNYKDANSAFWISDGMHACDYNIDGANPIAQAYTHLKTLPEFAGATDC
jgi:hypothetical protein